MRTCSACGYEVIPGNNFCANCGARYETEPAQVASDAAGGAAAPAAFDGQPATTEAVDFHEPAEAVAAPPGQFSAGPYATPGRAAASQYAPIPAAAAGAGMAAAPAGYGAQQPVAVCPKCGQAWTGSQSCTFCGQVWGLPKGIVLASAGRRLGGLLLDMLLIVCTLVIGWIVWALIAWTQGQSPAKQLLGMRVVRLDTRTRAGWGRMFLRDFVGKILVAVVSSLIPFVGNLLADCWLLWDKDNQELWDKLAGTVVVNDPDRRLALSGAGG
jgi:uncharacterized RDD family membrane protein YckC